MRENYILTGEMLEDIDESIPESLHLLLSKTILKYLKNKTDTVPNYEKNVNLSRRL